MTLPFTLLPFASPSYLEVSVYFPSRSIPVTIQLLRLTNYFVCVHVAFQKPFRLI